MRGFLRTLGAFSVLCSFAGGAAPALAQDKTILIVGEDADEDSVPRFSRTFVRVQGALTEELGDSGFEVFDERAASLGNFYQDRVRRTDADLAEIAASVSEMPVTLALSLSILATSDELRYVTRVRMRVTGRLIHVETGRRLGSIEIDGPRRFRGPVDCSRDCVLEVVNRHSKELANHVRGRLGAELVDLTDEGDRTEGGRGPSAHRFADSRYLDDEMTFQARKRFNRHQTASINGGVSTILAERP